jgi:hypothetical protein
MPSDYLTIDAAGAIATTQVLDRLATPTIYISVAATDDGVPSLTGHRQVEVRVLPENFHAPYFLRRLYSFRIFENAPVGTVISTLSAVDPDEDRGVPVIHTFSESDDFGNEDGDIIINAQTGQISLARALNRKQRASYYFTVQVFDGLFSATTDVLVTVDKLCEIESFKYILNGIISGNTAAITPFPTTTTTTTTTTQPTTTTTPRMYPIVNSWTMGATGMCNFPFQLYGLTHHGCVSDGSGLFVCEATPTLGGPAAIQYCDIEDGWFTSDV